MIALILSAFAENHEGEFENECEEFSASTDFALAKRAEKIYWHQPAKLHFEGGSRHCVK